MMLRKPGDPSYRAGSKVATRSSRRVAETPDEKVRKLQRSNKKCADCSCKMPQAANLSHGTFVCLTCAGIHREFNHRIKGIGHSTFSAEEAAFLSENGNEAVNAKYLASYSKMSERLRPPDGSTSVPDGQLIRVWIRRKYVDKAWFAGESGESAESGESNNNAITAKSSSSAGTTYQPTKVSIPPKKKSTPGKSKPAPATDLFGGGWDNTNDVTSAVPPSTENDDAWDAFGKSRSTPASGGQDPFAAPLTSNQQPSFQANFGQMQPQVQSNPQPVQQQQQQQQNSFNPNFQQQNNNQQMMMNQQQAHNNGNNFQQQGQVSQQSMPQPGFNANFQQQGQVPQQSMPQPGFNANFQQQVPQQPVPPSSPPPQPQPAFNANFQQQQSPSPGFNPSFQPQIESPHPTANTVVQQQGQSPAFNATFQLQGQQQLQTGSQPTLSSLMPPPQPPQPSVNVSVNANLQQQGQGIAPSLNSNLQQGYTQESMPQMQMMEPNMNLGMTMTTQQAGNNFMESQSTMIPSPTSKEIPSQNNVVSEITTSLDATNVQESPMKQKSSAISGMTNVNDAFDAFSSLSIVANNSTLSTGSNKMKENGDAGNESTSAPLTKGSNYIVGQKVAYKDSQGNLIDAEIIKVHLDDSLVPFYDIKMSDGREKQTDDAHLHEASYSTLTPMNGGSISQPIASISSLGDTAEKMKAVSSMMNGMNYEQLEKVEQFIKQMAMLN